MEELFDVCDPQGVPTGQRVTRSLAHREGHWHRSAHLWLINRQGQLLLQQRHPSKETDPERWDIAVAGHLSAGQSPLEALVREAFEELCLELDPAALTFLEVRRKEYEQPGLVDREWQHVFAGTWSGSLRSLTLQPNEVIDVRWLDAEVYWQALERRDPEYVDRLDDAPSFKRWLEKQKS